MQLAGEAAMQLAGTRLQNKLGLLASLRVVFGTFPFVPNPLTFGLPNRNPV